MKIFSPGKVNLALNVGPLQDDGYHQFDSIFHALEWGDVITIEPAETLSVTCSTDLGIAESDNLAYKAARAFDAAFSTDSRVAIHIEKELPSGGGLGGGSSNAAAVLYGLAVLNGKDPHGADILDVAATLGSDVPVFLAETGAPQMTGRGERVKAALPPATKISLVIAWPQGAHSDTGAVYKAFDRNPQPTRAFDELRRKLWVYTSDNLDEQATSLAHELYNNLSEAACEVTPQVADVLAFLRSQPQTLGAIVSGSGACSFALTINQQQAHELEQACREQGYNAKTTQLRAVGVNRMME